MQRRHVLASASTLLVAGCVSGGSGGTPTETTTTRRSPEFVDAGFWLTGSNCGRVREEASVQGDSEENAVVVRGTTSAPNACYSARLASAEYDADADELRVVVAAFRREDAGGCAQCITELDYEVTATFERGLPGRVVVVHRSRGGEREVASASP